MKKITDQQIDNLLSRNVVDVIVKKDLETKLRSGKKLRIKLGFDPTGARLHIGRAVTLWKLREFQDLGHQITFVIGDFTAQIGDSSDKDSERKMLTPEEIKKNVKDYHRQLSLILDMDKVELYHNADWHGKMNLKDFFKLTSLFTIQQMAERDNFAKRIKAGKPVGMHETLYPIFQGYDSVEMKTDLEVGGTDQLFNLLAGREVQKAYGMVPQNIMIFPLLEGTDGRKMSTSWGNCIYIDDEPEQMYGKIMSIRDELIPVYYKLATDTPLEIVEQIERNMAEGDNPRDTKASLARAVVARYHGDKIAQEAEANWNKQFREGNKPDSIKEVTIKPTPLLELVSKYFNLSKSEARRVFEQGGVKVNDKVTQEYNSKITQSSVVQVGKRRFVKFKL